MFHSASERGQRPAFADLPPTLQPCAVAASAPPTDHLRAAVLSGGTYALFAAAVVALSNLAPSPALAPARPPDSGPIVIYDPPTRFRVTLPPVAPAPGRGSGAAATVPPAAAPSTEVPDSAPTGLPTGNHSLDAVGTGPNPATGVTPAGALTAGTPAGSMVYDYSALGLTVLRQVDPVYPLFARQAHIQGPVVLLMTVDELGQPVQVQVLEGHPVFHEAARQAARQWRFEPARVNGRPVTAAFRLTLKFSLR